MLAAYYGHSDTAKYLLSESADINLKQIARAASTGASDVGSAQGRNKDMVLLLVKSGANP